MCFVRPTLLYSTSQAPIFIVPTEERTYSLIESNQIKKIFFFFPFFLQVIIIIVICARKFCYDVLFKSNNILNNRRGIVGIDKAENQNDQFL